jgi:hypothetical protein
MVEDEGGRMYFGGSDLTAWKLPRLAHRGNLVQQVLGSLLTVVYSVVLFGMLLRITSI